VLNILDNTDIEGIKQALSKIINIDLYIEKFDQRTVHELVINRQIRYEIRHIADGDYIQLMCLVPPPNEHTYFYDPNLIYKVMESLQKKLPTVCNLISCKVVNAYVVCELSDVARVYA